MLVAFHLAVFVVNELFTPQWQKNVRDISREVVAAMREALTDDSAKLAAFDSAVFFVNQLTPQWNGAAVFVVNELSPHWSEDFVETIRYVTAD